MANRNPVSFLLNQSADAQDNALVEAPAFSLTKVLSAAAVIVTPIATLLVKKIEDVNFSAANYVALALGVLGFLAIASSADVIGRSLATAAEKNATAATSAAEKNAKVAENNAKAAEKNAQVAVAGLGQFVPFKDALKGRRITDSTTAADPDVEIFGVAQAHEPFFLVKEGDSITWKPVATISIP